MGPPLGQIAGDEAVRAAVENLDTKRWLRTFGLTCAAVTATAVAGTALTDVDSRWYKTLRKPAIQPPPVVFPLAWTALYADIAAVSSLVIADLAETGRIKEQKAFIAALGANLVLNVGWNGSFFAAKKPVLATVESVALAISSVDLVRRAASVSPEKGVVLAPYAAWTAFASVLSGAIVRANRR